MIRVGIIGSGSFLAQAIRRSLEPMGVSIRNFHRVASEPDRVFSLPQNPVPPEQLLDLDVIYYTAGAGIQAGVPVAPADMLAVNAFYPISLLEELHARNFSGKWISFGSYFEIGEQTDPVLRSPDFLWQHSQTLPNLYCRSKNLLSRFLAQFVANGPSFVCQHFFLNTVYGKGEHPQRLLPYLLSGSPDEKRRLSAGLQVRQYSHVDDLALFFTQNLENQTPGLFAVGSQTTRRIREVAEMALSVRLEKTGSHPEVEFGTQSTRDQAMAFLGLQTDLLPASFRPFRERTLQEGLADYLD